MPGADMIPRIIYVIKIIGIILCSLAAIGKADKDRPWDAAVYIAIAFLIK